MEESLDGDMYEFARYLSWERQIHEPIHVHLHSRSRWVIEQSRVQSEGSECTAARAIISTLEGVCFEFCTDDDYLMFVRTTTLVRLLCCYLVLLLLLRKLFVCGTPDGWMEAYCCWALRWRPTTWWSSTVRWCLFLAECSSMMQIL